ncbi:MAG TPA: TonB-dependent receptor [Steroidobacteraceae bacterium]|jgi:outer membrane receptor protein involved in Fe transport
MLYLLTASLSWAPHASAQQAPAADQGTAPLEEVTVTGSRIRRTTDYTTPTPTTVLDATTLDNMGIVNIGEALQMTPSNVSAYTPQTTGGSSFFTGQFIPDLRGLNGFFTSRTLTMIDSHRAVPTSTGDSFDLNFIPQLLVERIDTVTGGASAAYGSGAEGGVLNIILNNKLEGGKFTADTKDSHYNDAKDNHVGAAYGHGLFDNRIHFVLGGEYEKQDPAECQTSGRSWCSENRGPYTVAQSPAFATESAVGTNLRTNVVSPTGAFGAASFYLPAFGYSIAPGQPLAQASPDGLGTINYTGNNAVGGAGSAAPGGQGLPSNQYTNLITGYQRSVLTGLFTAEVTQDITASLDLNWGKVNALNPGSNVASFFLAPDDPFLPVGSAAAVGAAATGTPGGAGYYVGKDWTSQIGNTQFNDTTLKRISLGVDGKIGQTSWTWNAYGEYGLTENVEGSPNEFTFNSTSMALDTVKGANGQPECRITANGGSFANAYASASAAFGGAPPFDPFGASNAFPSYLNAYNLFVTQPAVGAVINPVTGLTGLQTLGLLAQNCVPLNPFGTQQLGSSAAAYATGPLSLTLRYTQTDFALSTSGDLWKGIGAGAFEMAAGYEWRQEVVHNDFSSCPPGEGSAADQELCLARTTDFQYQFGNAYGGIVNVDEVFTEFNLPLLKDQPWAHALELDLAARESRYANKAYYAVGIDPGTTDAHDLTTWKASMLYEPVEGVRFRASQSRDSRAPSPRDLYYSQTFVPGSFFSNCSNPNAPPGAAAPPCYTSLIGNPDLKPETSDTTTLGIVFSPPQVRGLQASADWFHIHIKDGINGGSTITAEDTCAQGGPGAVAACDNLTFNSYSYNGLGQPCNAGVSGALIPSGGVDCTGMPTKTGVAAYQQNPGASNVTAQVGPAYNGAFYDERGVDLSLSYVVALPGGSTLSARALGTWVGEQVYQNYAGGPTYDLVGQNTAGTGFLTDYTNAPRWRGNMSLTWQLGGFSLTPNLTFIGEGTINNYGVEYNPSSPSTLATWILTGYPDAANPAAADHAAQVNAKALGYALLPANVANRVPAYFLFGLNAAYNFENIPGIKGLQLYVQGDNLFNKAPPFANNTTTYNILYDQIGLSYRVGFRLNF